MNFSGSIDGMDLAGVFQMFENQSLTGTFKIESHDEVFTFEICNGLLGNASCKSHELRRRINRYLYWAIGTKQIFRNYLVPTSGNPYNSMYSAFASGYLKEKHYLRAFKYFRQEMFLELFRKSRGHCTFTPHNTPDQGPAIISINHLLLESMTVIDDLRRKRKDFPQATLFTLTPEAVALMNQHQNVPSPFERPAFHLAEKMRSSTNLEALVLHSFLHKDHIIRILYGMKKKGWIQIESNTEKAPTLAPLYLNRYLQILIWALGLGVGLINIIRQ